MTRNRGRLVWRQAVVLSGGIRLSAEVSALEGVPLDHDYC